jgi:hypothetical protein
MRVPTLKGLNMNSPRCNLGKSRRRAPTLKGLNMKRSNSLREIIRNKKRVKKNDQNQPIFNTPGWGPHRPFPWLHLGLLILSRSARYFVSTPIGVGAFIGLSPGCTWGYSYYLAPLVTSFQPLSGLGSSSAFPQVAPQCH